MDIKDSLTQILGEGRLLENEPMSSHTSFHIGGPADLAAFPADRVQLAQLIRLCRETGLEYTILGRGTNVLVSDKGIRGLTVILNDSEEKTHIFPASDCMEDDGTRRCVEASASCPLTKVAMDAARAGLTGLEFGAGIPGSLGGAVVMNAGAYGGEIKDCLLYVTALDREGNELKIDAADLELGYRTSCVERKGLIITGACFIMEESSSIGILARIAGLNAKRRERQPLDYPSAGSTFKRPEGNFAGRLIEAAGLKGTCVGDAQVSEKHCGFVINKGNATAADVNGLIRIIQSEVYKQSGIRLETEIKFVGEK